MSKIRELPNIVNSFNETTDIQEVAVTKARGMQAGLPNKEQCGVLAWSGFHRLRWGLLGGWLFLVTAQYRLSAEVSASSSGDANVITNAAQVLSLTRVQAGEGRPVRIRGLVTLHQPNWQLFFVQDLTGGIYLYSNQKHPDLQAGQWIEIKGRTQQGRLSPTVWDENVRRLDTGEIPAVAPRPRRVAIDSFRDTQVDCQWIEIEAIVRNARLDAQQLVLEFGPLSQRVFFSIPWPSRFTNLSELVRSRVRVRGVCTFDSNSPFLKAMIFAASAEDLEVIAPGRRNLFEMAVQPVRTLAQDVSRPDADTVARVRGVITHKPNDTCCYVQDNTGGAAVRTDAPLDAGVGDEVDVAGFMSAAEQPPCVEDGVVRRLRPGVPVIPMVVKVHDPRSGALNDRLVTIEGRLVDYSRQSNHDLLTVLFSGNLLKAELGDTNDVRQLARLIPESALRLTGIWLDPDRAQANPNPRVLLRSAADVTVVRLPTWWTSNHILMVVGGLVATHLLGLIWAVSLHHQVRRQTENVRQRLVKEAQLEQSYRDLIEEAHDTIWIVDRAGRLLSVNRAGERMLGHARRDLIGRTITEFATPEARAAFEKVLKGTLGNDSGRIHELTVMAKDATRRILEVSSRPLAPGSGPEGVLMIARDVTKRRRAAAELAAAQQGLLETSRLAGMAEVATGVLHNVGNVLNSVNVSCTLSIDRLCQSKLANLPKITAMLDERDGDLIEFLTQDPKGQKIPGYLSSLAPVLVEEQAAVLKELYSLRDMIDHIKEIVAMQQSYARVSGVIEALPLSQLVEDAIKLNAGALTRHGVTAERQFEEVPPVATDKHKVIQILLNLIRNAKYACDESGRLPKLITLRIFSPGADRVAVQVIDNGVGIPPENLTRIFAHGFSTRKNGHGFGLHSGALAAAELGGSLSAQSAGLGHGATFTLELPLNPRTPS